MHYTSEIGRETYKICNKCVMDNSDKNLTFNDKGICSCCLDFDNRISRQWNYGCGHEEELSDLLNDIRLSGKDNEYDCILGLSGGLDSSYLLHLAVKEWNLRPFVFHVDAGWDLPLATENINKICNKLGLKLHVEKVNFEDMRQLQLAYFQTGLPDLDVPQDHIFISLVDKYSEKLNVKYILNGYNIATEVVSDPASWSCVGGYTADKTYLKDVLRKHGGYKTKDYEFTTGFRHKFWLPYIKGVKTVHPLNYLPITKKLMIDTLVDEYDYVPYEYKHYEDLFTKFLAGFWLPKRFGFDIRKAQLSSLIITGQMSREEALEILSTPAISEEESSCLFSQVANKLRISEEELQYYFELPKVYKKYRNNSWAFKLGIKLYTFLGIDKRIRK